MRAAYYEANGSARDVLRVAEVETPKPGPGEVRVKLLASGVNPSDVKNRAGITRKIAFPRVIPHSDGAGEIEAVAEGVPASRVGERVWVWNGQWRRPFGTAAQSIVLPAEQAVPLPAGIAMEAGACLGIPAYTAYQAVVVTGIG
jgi:NADPH2:quinone reductase